MRVLVKDITQLKDVEAIVNAANGVGPMGAGVAGAIGEAGGPLLRNEVRRLCEARRCDSHPGYGYEPGECYVSSAGAMSSSGIKHVYHAVTMKYPGSPTSNLIVKEAMRNTLTTAVRNGVKSIAFPGLGTGVGELLKEKVAVDMVDVASSFDDSIEITIADIDRDFINCVKRRIQTEAQ
jgi:O-acetyl-ADP-ribose deacetylase (regulator of RNase III)